jgi:hypothetical protein
LLHTLPQPVYGRTGRISESTVQDDPHRRGRPDGCNIHGEQGGKGKSTEMEMEMEKGHPSFLSSLMPFFGFLRLPSFVPSFIFLPSFLPSSHIRLPLQGIHMENSFKFLLSDVHKIAESSGFEVRSPTSMRAIAAHGALRGPL